MKREESREYGFVLDSNKQSLFIILEENKVSFEIYFSSSLSEYIDYILKESSNDESNVKIEERIKQKNIINDMKVNIKNTKIYIKRIILEIYEIPIENILIETPINETKNEKVNGNIIDDEKTRIKNIMSIINSSHTNNMSNKLHNKTNIGSIYEAYNITNTSTKYNKYRDDINNITSYNKDFSIFIKDFFNKNINFSIFTSFSNIILSNILSIREILNSLKVISGYGVDIEYLYNNERFSINYSISLSSIRLFDSNQNLLLKYTENKMNYHRKSLFSTLNQLLNDVQFKNTSNFSKFSYISLLYSPNSDVIGTSFLRFFSFPLFESAGILPIKFNKQFFLNASNQVNTIEAYIFIQNMINITIDKYFSSYDFNLNENVDYDNFLKSQFMIVI